MRKLCRPFQARLMDETRLGQVWAGQASNDAVHETLPTQFYSQEISIIVTRLKCVTLMSLQAALLR